MGIAFAYSFSELKIQKGVQFSLYLCTVADWCGIRASSQKTMTELGEKWIAFPLVFHTSTGASLGI